MCASPMMMSLPQQRTSSSAAELPAAHAAALAAACRLPAHQGSNGRAACAGTAAGGPRRQSRPRTLAQRTRAAQPGNSAAHSRSVSKRFHASPAVCGKLPAAAAQPAAGVVGTPFRPYAAHGTGRAHVPGAEGGFFRRRTAHPPVILFPTARLVHDWSSTPAGAARGAEGGRRGGGGGGGGGGGRAPTTQEAG